MSLPLTVASNESLTIPVNINYTSGNGIFETSLDFNLTHGEEDLTISESVLGFTEEIPLIYVYDDASNNFNTADLRGLLSTSGYSDYISMSSVDFRNYALRANGLKTLIWNAGSFGTTNGQEYSSFDDLRDNGTSIYYLGDGPLLIANIEESFNLDAFGASYGGTYSYGFSSGGSYSINGVSGDPVSDEFNTLSMGLTIFQSQGQTSAWPTIYTRPADENTFPIFSHTISADSAVAVRNERENSRSVISSFNMSNVENQSQRANVFKSIMDWLTYQDATGIFDLAGYEEFSVYPNPTVNEIRFDTDMRPDEVRIMDISGKTVMNINNTQNNIDVSQLVSGTYFLMVMENEEIKVSKFVKQ